MLSDERIRQIAESVKGTAYTRVDEIAAGIRAALAEAVQSVPVMGEPVGWVNEYCIDEWEHSQKDNWSGARLTAKEVPGSTVPLFRKPTHSIPAAELDALRKDAERYRWLRDGEKSAGTGMTDEAIDAHIAKERQS